MSGPDDGLFPKDGIGLHRRPRNAVSLRGFAVSAAERSRASTCTLCLDKLTSDRLGEPSDAVRARVEAAREVQRVRNERARFNGSTPEGTRAEGAPPEGRRLTCNALRSPIADVQDPHATAIAVAC
jgi:hypothetical protein